VGPPLPYPAGAQQESALVPEDGAAGQVGGGLGAQPLAQRGVALEEGGAQVLVVRPARLRGAGVPGVVVEQRGAAGKGVAGLQQHPGLVVGQERLGLAVEQVGLVLADEGGRVVDVGDEEVAVVLVFQALSPGAGCQEGGEVQAPPQVPVQRDPAGGVGVALGVLGIEFQGGTLSQHRAWPQAQGGVGAYLGVQVKPVHAGLHQGEGPPARRSCMQGLAAAALQAGEQGRVEGAPEQKQRGEAGVLGAQEETVQVAGQLIALAPVAVLGEDAGQFKGV